MIEEFPLSPAIGRRGVFSQVACPRFFIVQLATIELRQP